MITKMLDETNEKNTAMTLDLAKHFFLAPHDRDLLEDCTCEPPYPKSFPRELMNPHHRMFIEVPIDEESDGNWQKALEIFKTITGNPLFKDEDRIQALRMTYTLWNQGRTQNGQKLFKWLAKFTSQEIIEELTTSRTTGNNYLVISKNPMDWLFMSTGQSFRSCMSLESDYRNAYYLGTPLYMVNPCYFLVYITNGKVKSYEIKGLTFRHFRYIARNISIWCGDRLELSRYYPFRPTTPFENIPSPIQIANSDCWVAEPHEAFRKTLDLENGTEVEPYYDFSFGSGIPSSGGAWGSGFCLNWGGGFENLTRLDDLENQERCTFCGTRLHEDETRWTPSDDPACQDCFDEHYGWCERCEEYENRDDMYYINDRNEHWCAYCTHHHSAKCNDCGDQVSNYTYLEHLDRYICDDCMDAYTRCDHCETYHDDCDKTTDGYVLCPGCIAEETTTCDSCNEIFYQSATLTEAANTTICQACEEAYYITCETCGDIYRADSNEIQGSTCIYCIDEEVAA